MTFKERIVGLPCPKKFNQRQCRKLINKLKRCAGKAGNLDV